MICDGQVHAPNAPGIPERADPPQTFVGSISRPALLREMAAAGVDRAILSPIGPQYLDECLSWAREDPQRFAVLGSLPAEVLAQPTMLPDHMAHLTDAGCLAMRVGFFTDDAKHAFYDGHYDPVWRSAEDTGLRVSVLAAELLGEVASVAAAHPNLQMCIDHMGIVPRRKYSDFGELLGILLPLAVFANVSVKLTQIVRAVDEPYPYRSLHEPVRAVISEFGPHRVFWGSDFTVMGTPYRDIVTIYDEILADLSIADRELVMGGAVCQWVGWDF